MSGFTETGEWLTDGRSITAPAGISSERTLELATMNHFVPALERVANALVMTAGPRMLAALETARATIADDRDCLAECHTNPTTGELDALGREGVADYDNVLRIIDAAISKATGTDP